MGAAPGYSETSHRDEDICGKEKVGNLRPEVQAGESKQYEKLPGVTAFRDIDQVLALYLPREETKTLRGARVTDVPRATALIGLRSVT